VEPRLGAETGPAVIDAGVSDSLHFRFRGSFVWRCGADVRRSYCRVRVPAPVAEPQVLLMVQLEMVMVAASGEVAPVAEMVAPVAESV